MNMQTSFESSTATAFRFRTTQGTVDFLTAFALLDDTTLGDQVRLAIGDYLQAPPDSKIIDPIEPRKLIRRLETKLAPDVVTGIGAVAAKNCMTPDQALHVAFARYTINRLDSVELERTLESLTNRVERPPGDC